MINRYPGTCACGQPVPAGKGEIGADKKVVCMACHYKGQREQRQADRDYLDSLPPDRRWRHRR